MATTTKAQGIKAPPVDPLGLQYASASSSSSHGSLSIWGDKEIVLDDSSDATASDELALRSPMLKRYPSFVPLRRKATSIAEVAFLVPSSNCATRQATVAAATFNMTATIVGGGVLSIPLSCSRAGIVPFTLLMIMSALATDLSLYLLVSCSRRCGSMTFGNVARSAFGTTLEFITTGAVFFLVGCIVVGLMILNKGIWAPIIVMGLEFLLLGQGEAEGDGTTTPFQDAIVLLFLLVSMMPFLLKKDLTSLRHICFVGFFSIAILCVAMVYRAAEKNFGQPDIFNTNAKWFATSNADILNALPIILLAFLCSFNIISVSCSLVKPTRDRVKEVIHKSVFLSFLLMYVFGVAGYLFAYDGTNGNVLLNFDPKDPVILLGRIGCGITTLFALPMNALPCREALLSLASQVSEAKARRGGVTKEERQRLVQRRSAGNLVGEGGASGVEKSGERSEVGASIDEEKGAARTYGTSKGKQSGKGNLLALKTANVTTSCNENAIHTAATFGIILFCYCIAVLTPGVAIVWDVAGSSLAFLIQFIIPSACYIKLKLRVERHAPSKHLVLAWALLAFAVLMAGLCTTQTALRLSGKLT